MISSELRRAYIERDALIEALQELISSIDACVKNLSETNHQRYKDAYYKARSAVIHLTEEEA